MSCPLPHSEFLPDAVGDAPYQGAERPDATGIRPFAFSSKRACRTRVLLHAFPGLPSGSDRGATSMRPGPGHCLLCEGICNLSVSVLLAANSVPSNTLGGHGYVVRSGERLERTIFLQRAAAVRAWPQQRTPAPVATTQISLETWTAPSVMADIASAFRSACLPPAKRRNCYMLIAPR